MEMQLWKILELAAIGDQSVTPLIQMQLQHQLAHAGK
jgi:hypothetical protein